MIKKIHDQVKEGKVRISLHASIEMTDENILLDEVYEALINAVILEDYPDHRRGPCALASGTTRNGRPLHIVCTTSLSHLLIITVYEPKLPKWVTPTERRKKNEM